MYDGIMKMEMEVSMMCVFFKSNRTLGDGVTIGTAPAILI